MNSVNLIGRLGQDPRIDEEGQKWASFSLALNRVYRNDSGDKVEHTDWITIVAFNGLVRSAKRLSQGDRVGIEGRLRSRVYEKDGERRTAVEVLADRIHFLNLKDRPEGVAEEEEEQ